MYSLRDYQQLAVEHGVSFLTSATAGQRQMYSAPTGCGKSVVMLAIQDRVPDAWIIAPRVEIVAGFLQKRGVDTTSMSLLAIVDAGLERRITTPLRFKDMLLFREQKEPKYLLIDEVHHDEAATWQHVHALCGYPPSLGFTATAFRGTPRGTAALREHWGEPVSILSYPEAVARNVISMPRCATLPLVDDDLIEIERGELSASKVNSAVKSRVGQVAEYCRRFISEDTRWDRPTMFALPSRESAHTLMTALRGINLHAMVVDGETPQSERQAIFAATVSRATALIQISVVSEGVDLPIRRLIDLRPTLSPVIWLQLIGREMRPVGPGEVAPEYVCTNRNLLRHGYLLDGCLPADAIKDAQVAWPGPSKRGGTRVLGMESIGRFKGSQVPLSNGLQVTTYSVCAMEQHQRTDYFVIVHPLKADPVWAKAVHGRDAEGKYAWGRWTRCEPPAELTGFASTPPNPLSDKQREFWERAAERYGLVKDSKPTRQQFAILPVVANINEVLK